MSKPRNTFRSEYGSWDTMEDAPTDGTPIIVIGADPSLCALVKYRYVDGDDDGAWVRIKTNRPILFDPAMYCLVPDCHELDNPWSNPSPTDRKTKEE